MILLIDNYDSFSYNLYQLIGSIDPDIKVARNDKITIDEIRKMSPDSLIISPGPGRPEDAGICIEAVREFTGRLPILGVCLGHQAICMAFGTTITYAKQLMHGKQSDAFLSDDPLFRGCRDPIPVARYHSLAADPDTLADCLKVIAVTKEDDGTEEIMAVKHKDFPVYGLQFHPESIMTPDGSTIMKNFIELTGK